MIALIGKDPIPIGHILAYCWREWAVQSRLCRESS